MNDILNPYIKENEYICKNSTEFVEMTRKLKVGPNEKMISYDATALFPSVPITEAIAHIRTLLANDPDLKSRTKLSPDEICDLISLCLSSSNFLYDDRHHTQKDSGPIGLSLMVTVSQIWMIYTIEKAIQIARSRNLTVPRHLKVYMDDCWGLVSYPRQGLRSSSVSSADPAVEFNQCLNEVHPRVQFTREDEIDGAIAFLDVHLQRENNGKISTSVYRKPSNTNITIKPNSCQHPNTAIASFKSELCRAHRICSTDAHLQKEITFITNLFVDNGHDRALLQKVASSYKPPTTTTDHTNKKRITNKNKHNCKQKDTPDNLFDILPFRDIDLTDKEEYQPYCRIPYIPGGIFHEIRRALKDAGVNTCATSGQKLGQVLCGKNKTHPDQK